MEAGVPMLLVHEYSEILYRLSGLITLRLPG